MRVENERAIVPLIMPWLGPLSQDDMDEGHSYDRPGQLFSNSTSAILLVTEVAQARY